jgi:alkyl hydroperoxide reductase subunit D
MITLAHIKDRLPDWARDLKLNLAAIGAPGELSPRLAWGTALAAAVAARNVALIEAIAAEAAPHLDDAAARAARAAAAIMGMNNVYYRFQHMMEGASDDYASLPARLRMQVIGNPGVPKAEFELWCLAVSAINGCEACVRAHEKVARAGGMTAQMVLDAVRIAAIVHGAAVALDAEMRYPIPREDSHVLDTQQPA